MKIQIKLTIICSSKSKKSGPSTHRHSEYQKTQILLLFSNVLVTSGALTTSLTGSITTYLNRYTRKNNNMGLGAITRL